MHPDSWPIEAGLAWIDPNGAVRAEGRLIRPEPDWPASAWSRESEQVHGIPRSDLDKAEPAAGVARWLIETVGSATLLSDAPEWDQRWLDRLLKTQLHAPPLVLEDFDRAAWGAFATEAPLNADPLRALYEERARRRTTHRAAADASDMAEAWAAALRMARAL